jgi:5-methylthioribose kinase
MWNINLEKPDELESYLRQKELFLEEELKEIEKAGEGNMNLTLRVSGSENSFILKQSRAWVEKYPSIPAPEDRILVESAFYGAIQSDELLTEMSPKPFFMDEENRIFLMQDLGHTQDLTSLYETRDTNPEKIKDFVSYLIHLHSLEIKPRDIFKNRNMRELNHEHIFKIPLSDDQVQGLDEITPGLTAYAEKEILKDSKFCSRIQDLGRMYLLDGPVLLHGDFYPGSWMEADSKRFVLDPEFAYLGSPEFDLGVMWAHLLFIGYKEEEINRVMKPALKHKIRGEEPSLGVVQAFAGAELTRRLLGVAQLPFERSFSEKKEYLEIAKAYLSHDLSIWG